MTRVQQTLIVDADGLEELRQPRGDVVVELPDGPDAWTYAAGPFRSYQRSLVAEPGPEVGWFTVTERFDYQLAIPLWSPFMTPLFKSALKSRDRQPKQRWWWPKEVVAAETSALVAFVGTIGLMCGYMGVLIGQTITFSSRDFGVGDDVQSQTLAAVRIGVILSTAFLWIADKRGRRPLIIGFTLAAIGFTVAGAFASSMGELTFTQAIARGLTTGLFTLIGLAATEEVPASSRAMSIGFLTLMAGVGAGGMAFVLPFMEVAEWAWRVAYLVPVVYLPLLWWVSKNLPETRRFKVAEDHDSSGTVNWWWFVMIAVTSFTSFIFLSPASQLRNEFMTDDRGYSAPQLALFQIIVALPTMMAIPIGALIADRYGRKYFGAAALALSTILISISFVTSGPTLWITTALGAPLAAATIPALRGYGVELFPTKARGKVGGWFDIIGVSGSAVGLLAVGWLSVRWGDLGQAVAVMAPFALLTSICIVVFYPETANRELEEFNPGDPSMLEDTVRIQTEESSRR